MKIRPIGDIHGRTTWKKIASDDMLNVFIGDYFDSHDKKSNFNQQIENFQEIVAYKESHPNTILLLGNHDYHYLRGIDSSERYSGYQAYGALSIQEVLENAIAKDHIKITHYVDDFLFSHAGVSKTFISNWYLTTDTDYSDVDILKIDMITELFETNRKALTFYQPYHKMYRDPYGNNIFQSPIWIRPESLAQDGVDVYKQIVGHTQVDHINITANEKFIQIDALENGEFIEIDTETKKIEVMRV